ncbi:hypothetical protein [Streptomyces sp. NBC_01235]|uniref:hypothetical protein n=1 Tax=Streptomyces sp. NBC_01235 TaxID=2903788 RepID=UPI002E121D29|nr:hypothetical protein OG289_38835 [Streptomyces sp. NBC_01235]
MAVLLFSVVFTHGLSAESVKGHLVTSAVAPAAAAHEAVVDAEGERAVFRLVAIGDPGDGHGSSHPSEQCVSGQPQQGPVLTPPCCAVSVGESAPVGRVLDTSDSNGSVLSATSSTGLRSAVVQQV